MGDTAKIVANILNRLSVMRDEALKALDNYDEALVSYVEANDADVRTIIELRSLATNLYDVLHQYESDEFDDEEDAEDEP